MAKVLLCLTAAWSLAGCGLEAVPEGEVPGTRVEQSALKGGCHYDCPKCPANQICPKYACVLKCPSKPMKCGQATCQPGEYCCNESCGTCAPVGGVCTQQYCGPDQGGCTQTALCVQGYVWSDKACACVPEHGKPTAPGACATDADCRTFDDYCTGCDCRALSVSDPDPVCDGPGVRCFAQPCLNQAAVCVQGTCQLQSTL